MRDENNLAQIKVINKTNKEVSCYVAIDGQKIRFRLRPLRASRWFKANKVHYNHSQFSTWCDYSELHPKYEKYTLY